MGGSEWGTRYRRNNVTMCQNITLPNVGIFYDHQKPEIENIKQHFDIL